MHIMPRTVVLESEALGWMCTLSSCVCVCLPSLNTRRAVHLCNCHTVSWTPLTAKHVFEDSSDTFESVDFGKASNNSSNICCILNSGQAPAKRFTCILFNPAVEGTNISATLKIRKFRLRKLKSFAQIT